MLLTWAFSRVALLLPIKTCNESQEQVTDPNATKTLNGKYIIIPRAELPHLFDSEELARVQVHPEVDLPERTGPDELPLPPPDRRVLLSFGVSFSPYPTTSTGG